MSDPPPSLPAPVAPPSPPDRITAAAAALGLDPGRALRWALIGGGVLAVAVGAWLLVGGRTPPPELTLPRAGGPGDPGALDAERTTDTSEAADGPVTAHAAGAVARPGVYRLPPAARVTDLIDAAGGPASGADLDQLNLAASVSDGDRVYVPRQGELAVPAGAPGGAATPAGPLDLNRATAAELDALPGVGPATAQAILDHRGQHGRFRSVDDLLEVRGIGPAKLEQLRSLVRV